MFYFKGQKREIRRPIIKVFSKLNWDSFSNDNFIITSKKDQDTLTIIRLYCGVQIHYPQYFGYEQTLWSEDKKTCLSTQWAFLKMCSVKSEIKNIDGIFYELVTMQVETIKEFSSHKDYQVFKAVTVDEYQRKDLYLLEEQVIDLVLRNNGINVDLASRSDLSSAVFAQMETLIEKSMSLNDKKLAS